MDLIRNAVESMHESSERRLIIRAARRDVGSVELSVTDSGPGIPASILPRMFEPFATTNSG